VRWRTKKVDGKGHKRISFTVFHSLFLLQIPPELGYGDIGSLPYIPGGATLVIEVELVSIEEEGQKIIS